MESFIIENRILKKLRGRTKGVVIPEGVEVIAGSAFKNRYSIKSIYIPEGVTKIEGCAFFDCDSLESLSLPESVVSIGDFSFRELVKGTRYEDCNYLGNEENPYYLLWSECTNCKQPSKIHSDTKLIYGGWGRPFAKLPESAYIKYDNAFYVGSAENPYHLLVKTINTDIQTCNIHKDTKIINASAFQDCCHLETLSIPEGVCHIGSAAFMGCSNLRRIGLPNSLKAISHATFKRCKTLEELVLPNGILHISGHAFLGCESLVEVVVPNGVLTLEDYSFGMCHNLQKVMLPETLISIDGHIFCSSRIDTSIQAPPGSYAEQYAKENKIPFVAV